MEKSKNLIVIVIIISMLTIGVATALKVYNSHLDNHYKVATKKICEAARKCYIDNKCTGQEVTIDTLISYNYLERLVDPKTKEYINGSIIVHCENYACSVDIK